MMYKGHIYFIWLSEAVDRSYCVYRYLLEHFDTPYDVYRADEEGYLSLGKKVERYLDRLLNKDLSSAANILDYCKSHKIGVLTYEDEAYPSLLRQIEDPPLTLYVRGKMPDFENRLFVAVVGTRKMTDYGKYITYNISRNLAKNGAVIVSGVALGNDSVSMSAALDSHGETVGVLGCGVDIAYPPEHSAFIKELSRYATVISEYPPGTMPQKTYFPKRNRIISGLSRATLVVEGDLRSGSLITARKAALQGRDVFAVPGKLGDTMSEGPLKLLSEGAFIATSANDILRQYVFLYNGRIDMKTYPDLSYSDIDSSLYRHSISFKKSSTNALFDLKKDAYDDHNSDKMVKKTRFSLKSKNKKEEKVKHEDKSVSSDIEKKLEGLGADVVEIYNKLPHGNSFGTDEVESFGISVKEFLSCITILEIYGIATSLPGGRYKLG